MAVLRFTPEAAAGGVSSEGLYSVGSVWSPQQVPAAGDTAIMDHGTVDVVGTTISGVSLFVVSAANRPAPKLSLQNAVLAAGSTLVLDSRALSTPIALQVTLGFSNAGTIDVLGQISLTAFAGAASAVNTGTINLINGAINTFLPLENDGLITVGNAGLTTLASRITGTGTIALKSNSTVETTSVIAGTQTYRFLGGPNGNSTLQVDSPVGFTSPIAGFARSDNILLRAFAAGTITTSYVATGANSGTLLVGAGGSTASLNFIGSYAISDFTVSRTTTGVAVTTGRTDSGLPDTTSVYRFFDTGNGTHFFTGSAAERDAVVTSRSDLVYEGVGLTATDPNGPAATPVFRFFDSRFGTHFYTASAAERDGVIASRPDLQFEGTGFYADATPRTGDSAVYRFFDTNYGTHFYTASAAESAGIQATRSDLKYEGVSFYSAT